MIMQPLLYKALIRYFPFEAVGIDLRLSDDFAVFLVLVQGIISCFRASSIFGKRSLVLSGTCVSDGLSVFG